MNRIFKSKINNIMQKKTEIPFGMVLPALITLASIVCGMTAVLFASKGNFESAVIAIVLAAVFDAFDGRVARLLKSSSQFGVELDSLADSISFGVSPAFIMYFYSLNNIKGFGWVVSVSFAISCVLRLARFNVASSDDSIPEYWHYFFTGVPAPAGALLTLLPIMLFKTTSLSIFLNPLVCLLWMVFIAFLMISKVPTLSLKKLKIAKENISFILFLLGLILTLIYFYFWTMASVIWGVYFLTIPLTVIRFFKMKNLYRC